jgi:isocitrate dehydrogenase (NAD+)
LNPWVFSLDKRCAPVNSPSHHSRIEATLIPGDGIGPELVEAVQIVFDGLGSPFVWDVQQGGMGAVHARGDPLPAETLESIRRTRLALKGPLTTPIGGGFRSVNVRLREELGLYANVRPVRTILRGGRYDNIDLVLIRENLEGFYVGFEHYVAIGDDPRAVAIASGVNTRVGARRIIRFAFEYTLRNRRRRVTVVHKANVLKALSGLFLETGREVAREFEGRIEMNDRIVDACAMQLVTDPWQFDVIVATNLFGDILSDEMAGLVGGLGLAPGANIGEHAAMFEAVHGSAPDIAGKGIANPISLLLACGLMLDHVGERGLAQRLRTAIDLTVNEDGIRTRDLDGGASTREFVAAVVRRL